MGTRSASPQLVTNKYVTRYGDVACYTVSGRIMTVLYAIVGIPLMLITLNDLGKFLYKAINGVVKLVKGGRTLGSKLKKKQFGELDAVERGEANATTAPPPRVEFQLSLDGDELLTVESTEEESSPIEEPGPPPRMPVTVATGTTVGWIFFCAALFKTWEHDWTYAESCYFMFISLSTIGLGDVAVKRRDLMVLCFVFVIIGLSLVSMCINVIQTALEDLYMKLLMKLLVEYQSKLAQGNDAVGASVGMMKLWGSNRTAKYLMPLLSKEKRMTAMAKVQEEAESKGIEIPPIFSDLDVESGMPKILKVAGEETSREIEQAIQHAEYGANLVPSPPPLQSMPTIVYYDSYAQTDDPILSEKTEQTEITELHDSGISTDIRFADYLCTAVQCCWDTVSVETQTTSVETSDTEVMTFCQPSSESGMQTEGVATKEGMMQTQLVDYLECGAQTELANLACQAVQTPIAEFADNEVQTDEIAGKRRRRLLKNDRRRSADPSLSEVWEERVDGQGSESSASTESLDWNPIDGMHAEKQRPVRDLTRFFDRRIRGKNSE
ncbi:TWiK family of potassium channels protein 18 [Toxocara canis]|uniref:TWiK family of potassium channels protein 18 n=1 Tax=Toxocara canis TaxID=6265 RepID=A0A0B2V5I7_TOXCA|nr:TWiK family of potassium channels protein 18 [Toxocara canis]